jgi:hypothetical protein
MYIYPNDLNEKKLFLKLTIYDLIVAGFLIVFFVIYASRILSIIPLVVPLTFCVFKVRMLEHDTNLWQHILKVFNFFIKSQQEYYWGKNKK